jgi:hypothetical protein
MDREEVVVKRIVSPDGKVVSEFKSVARVSGDTKSEIRQSISINVSSESNFSSSSQSGSISVSCAD